MPETNSPPINAPEKVAGLLELGYIETNALFNVTYSDQDGIRRYDLIHPESDKRILWTPPSDDASMELISEVIADDGHPVFFPLLDRDAQGNIYQLPTNVRLLADTLNSSPYIPEYMERLEQNAQEFMGKIALLDTKSFGLDMTDLVINHNGDEQDDVFFSILPPVRPSTDENFSLDKRYKAEKRRAIRRYTEGLR